MPRFFVDSAALTVSPSENAAVPFVEKRIVIRGGDAVHIARVLRMRPGERLVVCDETGVEYEGVLCAVGEVCELTVRTERPSRNEPPYRAVVYQSLVKGDRMDTVLQKGTELGAARFVPVLASCCVARLAPGDAAKKLERWRRIVEEAAKQCGRAKIPLVDAPVPLSDALLSCDGLRLFCYEGEGTVPLPDALSVELADVPERTVSLFIGPEGGFEPEEVRLAKNRGAVICGLGRRILRTETAPAFVLSCLSYRYELPCQAAPSEIG